MRCLTKRPGNSVLLGVCLAVSFGCASHGNLYIDTWDYIGPEKKLLGRVAVLRSTGARTAENGVELYAQVDLLREWFVSHRYQVTRNYGPTSRGVLAPSSSEEFVVVDPPRDDNPPAVSFEGAKVERRRTGPEREAIPIDRAMMVRWSVDALEAAGIAPASGIATLTRTGYLAITISDETADLVRATTVDPVVVIARVADVESKPMTLEVARSYFTRGEAKSSAGAGATPAGTSRGDGRRDGSSKR